MENLPTSISLEKLASKVRTYKISDLVAELEKQQGDSEKELGALQATFLINYGINGKTVPGLVNEKMCPLAMFITIAEFYHKIYQQYQLITE